MYLGQLVEQGPRAKIFGNRPTRTRRRCCRRRLYPIRPSSAPADPSCSATTSRPRSTRRPAAASTPAARSRWTHAGQSSRSTRRSAKVDTRSPATSSTTTAPAPTSDDRLEGGCPMTFTTRPTLRGTFGMVSSTHWLASQSAMRILELGGNAFDAARRAPGSCCTWSSRTSTGRAARCRDHRHRRRPGAAGALRSGRRAGRRDDRALPVARPDAGARLRPARGRGSRRGRRLAAAAARPRHLAAARRPRAGDRLRAATGTRWSPRIADTVGRCSSSSRSTGRRRPRSGCKGGRRRGPAVQQRGVRRDARAARAPRGAGRTGRPRSSGRGRPGGKGSSPRRSTSSRDCRIATRAARTTPA